MAICCLFHHPQQVCENACMAVRIVEYGLPLISPPLIELKVLVIIGKPIFTIGKSFPLKSNGGRFEMVTQCDCVNNCITLVLHMYLRCTHSTDIRYVNTVVPHSTLVLHTTLVPHFTLRWSVCPESCSFSTPWELRNYLMTEKANLVINLINRIKDTRHCQG